MQARSLPLKALKGWSLKDKGYRGKLRVGKAISERRFSDEAIADVLVPVFAAAEIGLAVVEVDRPDLFEAKLVVDRLDDAFEVVHEVVS